MRRWLWADVGMAPGIVQPAPQPEDHRQGRQQQGAGHSDDDAGRGQGLVRRQAGGYSRLRGLGQDRPGPESGNRSGRQR
jgi:hypothetical protein